MQKLRGPLLCGRRLEKKLPNCTGPKLSVAFPWDLQKQRRRAGCQGSEPIENHGFLSWVPQSPTCGPPSSGCCPLSRPSKGTGWCLQYLAAGPKANARVGEPVNICPNEGGTISTNQRSQAHIKLQGVDEREQFPGFFGVPWQGALKSVPGSMKTRNETDSNRIPGTARTTPRPGADLEASHRCHLSASLGGASFERAKTALRHLPGSLRKKPQPARRRTKKKQLTSTLGQRPCWSPAWSSLGSPATGPNTARRPRLGGQKAWGKGLVLPLALGCPQ